VIFEMRTYLLRPGAVPLLEEAFGKALPARAKLSRLGGFWRTEVGTLNQVIHVWPYQDAGERARIRADAVKRGIWPPNNGDTLVEQETKILHPAPFSPHFEPGEHGNLYEFRTYTFAPAAIPRVVEAWAPLVKARTAVSPLIFAGYTDIGPLNQWVHVWAYKNMADREARRAHAMKSGQWPPPRPVDVVVLRQESIFAVPAGFSPLR